MRCYKLDGLNITAGSDELAKTISQNVPGPDPRRLILIPKDGSAPVLVPLSVDAEFDVCVQLGADVEHVGSLMGGIGNKMVQAALDTMDKSRSFNGRLSERKRVAKRERRQDEIKACIEAFELSIPSAMRRLYDDVMIAIDANNEAYKLEIIDGIYEKGVTIKAENWQPILAWFNTQVLKKDMDGPLKENRTFYQLRAAFVTTACRMVQNDARNTNAMRLVQQADKDFDWAKYAEEN